MTSLSVQIIIRYFYSSFATGGLKSVSFTKVWHTTNLFPFWRFFFSSSRFVFRTDVFEIVDTHGAVFSTKLLIYGRQVFHTLSTRSGYRPNSLSVFTSCSPRVSNRWMWLVGRAFVYLYVIVFVLIQGRCGRVSRCVCVCVCVCV